MSLPQTNWQGTLVWVLLFKGSKSEGEYPLLTLVDGSRLRLYVRGESSEVSAYLRTLDQKHVHVKGVWDDLRGHPRLVVNTTEDVTLCSDPYTQDSDHGLL